LNTTARAGVGEAPAANAIKLSNAITDAVLVRFDLMFNNFGSDSTRGPLQRGYAEEKIRPQLLAMRMP
jgi:hypothetical protein